MESTKPKSSGSEWLCFTCREGLWITKSSNDGEPRSGHQQKGYFLPDPLISDDQILKEPELASRLSDEEISELFSPHSQMAVAATFTGPPQDKKNNEDFSLSAVIRGASDVPWAFIALADGVTTKTFWPARAARISVLTAFQVVRQAIQSGFKGDDEDLEKLRNDLSFALRRELLRDREFLQSQPGLIPNGWAPDLYRDFTQNVEYWYNSTLLVACLGPAEGFTLWAGDGGVSIIKEVRAGERRETLALQSTDDLAVGTFVSLNVSSSQFRMARINYLRGRSGVEVYLASDGVDRTLQREDLKYSGIKALTSPSRSRQFLHQLATRRGRELDNYSIAWVCGPPPSTFTWRSTPQSLQAVRSTDNSHKGPLRPKFEAQPPESDPPPDPASIGTPISAASTNRSPIWRGLLLVLFGFALGIVTGFFLTGRSDQRTAAVSAQSGAQTTTAPQKQPGKGLPLRKDHSVEVTPTAGAQPPLPEPDPILIGEEDRVAMNSGRLLSPMKASISGWARFLNSRPAGRRYSVVVYGMRQTIDDSVDCKNQLWRAQARSELIVSELARQTTFSEVLDLQARANVCAPPPGVADLLDVRSVRAVLTDTPPTCICRESSRRARNTDSKRGDVANDNEEVNMEVKRN